MSSAGARSDRRNQAIMEVRTIHPRSASRSKMSNPNQTRIGGDVEFGGKPNTVTCSGDNGGRYKYLALGT